MNDIRSRPGVTLVELLLFISLMAVASGAVLGFLFLTADARVRQRGRADVQLVAVQLQQQLSHEIRSAERVLLPARGASGSILALQTASEDDSPVIVATLSGRLLLVRGANAYPITPENLTARTLRVENRSLSDARPSVHLTLILERRIELPNAEYATADVELAVTLPPADDPVGDDCGCALPQCGGGALTWESCLSGGCVAVSDPPIACP